MTITYMDIYIHDSNSTLKYDYNMFHKYNGTFNNYCFNQIFKKLVELITQISSNCSFELTAKNMGTEEGAENINCTADINESVLKSAI